MSIRLRSAEGRGPDAAMDPHDHPLAAAVYIAATHPERTSRALEELTDALPTLLRDARVDVELANRTIEVLRRPWSGDRRMLLRGAWQALTHAVLEGASADFEAQLDALDRAAAAVMLAAVEGPGERKPSPQ